MGRPRTSLIFWPACTSPSYAKAHCPHPSDADVGDRPVDLRLISRSAKDMRTFVSHPPCGRQANVRSHTGNQRCLAVQLPTVPTLCVISHVMLAWALHDMSSNCHEGGAGSRPSGCSSGREHINNRLEYISMASNEEMARNLLNRASDRLRTAVRGTTHDE